ncbi:MAG: hypothetical protein HY253_00760 [Burkholderiales bacterium]|nr:hypothetical protein [Burkholderiales bacterium]
MSGIIVSDLDQLIRFAFDGFVGGIPVLPHEKVESVRRTLALSPSAFFDMFARRVAHEYDLEELSFEVADCAMNSLSGYCLSQYDVDLPSFAKEVYFAFDQGEFRHQGDHDAIDPEAKYTRPRIRSLVVRDQILGA